MLNRVTYIGTTASIYARLDPSGHTFLGHSKWDLSGIRPRRPGERMRRRLPIRGSELVKYPKHPRPVVRANQEVKTSRVAIPKLPLRRTLENGRMIKVDVFLGSLRDFPESSQGGGLGLPFHSCARGQIDETN